METDTNSNDSHYFEGVEKLLEVWFTCKDGAVHNSDLRKVPRLVAFIEPICLSFSVCGKWRSILVDNLSQLGLFEKIALSQLKAS